MNYNFSNDCYGNQGAYQYKPQCNHNNQSYCMNGCMPYPDCSLAPAAKIEPCYYPYCTTCYSLSRENNQVHYVPVYFPMCNSKYIQYKQQPCHLPPCNPCLK